MLDKPPRHCIVFEHCIVGGKTWAKCYHVWAFWQNALDLSGTDSYSRILSMSIVSPLLCVVAICFNVGGVALFRHEMFHLTPFGPLTWEYHVHQPWCGYSTLQ